MEQQPGLETCTVPEAVVPEGTRTRWPVLISLALAVLVALALVPVWLGDAETAWGLALPVVALLAARERRGSLQVERAEVRWAWMLWLAGVMLIGVGFRPEGGGAANPTLAGLGAATLIVGCVGARWGGRGLRTLAGPLLLLYLAVPFPAEWTGGLARGLASVSTSISTALLDLSRIPFVREGNVLILSDSLSLQVAEACGGLRSFGSLMAAGAAVAVLTTGPVVRRLLLVPAAAALAMVLNVIRLTGTALVARVDLGFAEGTYHALGGWIAFAVAVGLLLVLARLMGMGSAPARVGEA